MVDNQVNILIKSFFDDKAFASATTSLAKIRDATESIKVPQIAQRLNIQEQSGLFKQLTTDSMGFRQELMQNAYLNKFGLSLNTLGQAAADNSQQFQGFQASLRGGGWEAFNNKILHSGRLMQKFGMDSSQVKQQFQMYALGIMFLGMQIQKTMSRLAKSSVADFMKITEGITESGQAINTLTASWTLLKFSIGEAIASVLEALLPIIMPIILAITNWVQQHKKLAGWLIIGGIILATFLFLVGQGVLGIVSLVQGIGKLIGILSGFGPVITLAITSIMGFLGLSGLGGLIVLVGLVIVAIIILVAAWESNFGNIRDFTIETFGIILELVKIIVLGLWEIIKTVLDLIVAIFQGRWGDVWDLTKKLGNQLFVLFLKIVGGLAMIIYNFAALLVNLLKDAAFSIVKLFVYLGNQMDRIWTIIWTTIRNLAIEGVNFIINQLNKMIDKLANITIMGTKPFAWLSALKMNAVPLVDLNTELAKTDQRLQQGLSTLDSWQQTLTIPTKTLDDYKEMGAMIDANNKFAQETTSIVAPTITPTDTTNQNNQLLTLINSTKTQLGLLNNQSKVTQETSAAVTQQNIEETQSWEYKNDAVQKHIDLLKQYQQQLNINIGGTSGIDLSNDVPNFVLQRK